MISVYDLKPKFQKLLKPFLNLLYRIGVSANFITWSALILSIGTGVLIWLHPYGFTFILLPVSLFIRMGLNALDGMMAVTFHQQSKKGEMLNEMGDVVSDFLIFFPLLKLFQMNVYILIAFLFLSLINEYSGVLGKAVSGIRRYEGPMGKSDRAFVISIISLISFFTHFTITYINYIFIGINFLLFISTYIRISKTLRSK